MADSQILRQKRVGNYVPERIRLLEPEIAERYANGESAASLARHFNMSKVGIQSAVRRQGGTVRGKAEAGLLQVTINYILTTKEVADVRPIAQQVAEQLGYPTHTGLSTERAFQSAVARERRRRSAEKYRAMDKRRKEHLYRIPKWQNPGEIAAFYEMARDLGLEVDHIIPLQGVEICGLNVMSNLRLISSTKNGNKQNRLLWTSDPLIGPPSLKNS